MLPIISPYPTDLFTIQSLKIHQTPNCILFQYCFLMLSNCKRVGRAALLLLLIVDNLLLLIARYPILFSEPSIERTKGQQQQQQQQLHNISSINSINAHLDAHAR